MPQYCIITLRPCPNRPSTFLFFFFFNHTATTEIYTLSLHDALPIFPKLEKGIKRSLVANCAVQAVADFGATRRSEEHTSELQSRRDLVCRLLLEKKKNNDAAKKYGMPMRSIELTDQVGLYICLYIGD